MGAHRQVVLSGSAEYFRQIQSHVDHHQHDILAVAQKKHSTAQSTVYPENKLLPTDNKTSGKHINGLRLRWSLH